MSTILGINAYHADSAACLFVDGKLIAAAEEERFRRIKHWAGFPSAAIGYCLQEAGLKLGEIEEIAINRDPRAGLFHKLLFTLRNRPSLALLRARLANRQRWSGIEAAFREEFPDSPPRARLHFVEHHHAHLASAYYASPFEHALALSLDGFGDFASTAWGLGAAKSLAVEGRIRFPHSLGIFYQAITQYLGFRGYGDEYKVMGLSAYGRPSLLPEMLQVVQLEPLGRFRLNLDCFRHSHESVEYLWQGGAPQLGDLYTAALEALLGPARREGEEISARHRDIAASAQAAFEEALFHLLEHLQRQYGVEDLALAGGCAFNSLANGRIRRRTSFRRVFVQPAAGDAGGALGAALVVRQRLKKSYGRFVMNHANWGPRADPAQIASVIEARADAIAAAGCRVKRASSEPELVEYTAEAIASGAVVGWFQGRMEWGPRALGNRSILADPRRADMKDIINSKIKRRESFRPFAPSILREAVAEWFEVDDDVPFMAKVYPLRAEKRGLVPAVVHVDGSGRLQTVRLEGNPLYHRLIACFAKLTGIPMLLNTSFNENEPVVCGPREALDCFLRTNMDLLVLGDTFVVREGAMA